MENTGYFSIFEVIGRNEKILDHYNTALRAPNKRQFDHPSASSNQNDLHWVEIQDIDGKIIGQDSFRSVEGDYSELFSPIITLKQPWLFSIDLGLSEDIRGPSKDEYLPAGNGMSLAFGEKISPQDGRTERGIVVLHVFLSGSHDVDDIELDMDTKLGRMQKIKPRKDIKCVMMLATGRVAYCLLLRLLPNTRDSGEPVWERVGVCYIVFSRSLLLFPGVTDFERGYQFFRLASGNMGELRIS